MTALNFKEAPTFNQEESHRILEFPELRNKTDVFRGRSHAGDVLADMLKPYRGSEAIVCAIPAGGVPVAKRIAERLRLPLEIAAISKVILPWNTEAGYGAVSFNGLVELNEELISQVGLSRIQVKEGVERTLQKVKRRMKELRGEIPFPDLSQKTAILVDDGLASGFTMQVAVEALRKEGAGRILIGVPTGHDRSVHQLAKRVEAVYCPNVRSGWSFAVAEAYAHWYDVDEEEVLQLLMGETSHALSQP